MGTYTTLRATIITWTIEEGCKVIESVEHVDRIVSATRTTDLLLATGRRWLTPWRSVEWSYIPVEEA